MASPKNFRAADFYGDGKADGGPQEINNSVGLKLYRTAKISWENPSPWLKSDSDKIPKCIPIGTPNIIYCIFRSHGNSHSDPWIEYVGITDKGPERFVNHATAQEIRQKRGQTYISVGTVSFENPIPRGKTRRACLEDIEHLLIWILMPEINKNKQWSLPKLGGSGKRAWHIFNQGPFDFGGDMPSEIIFPWALVKVRRGRPKTNSFQL